MHYIIFLTTIHVSTSFLYRYRDAIDAVVASRQNAGLNPSQKAQPSAQPNTDEDWITAEALAIVEALGEQHAPPVSAAVLCERIAQFRSSADSLPPPRPPFEACPGVYGRGCGGKLEYKLFNNESADKAQGFWGCEYFYHSKKCAYVFVPPKRLLDPQLSVEIASATEIQVIPVLGAEEIVDVCGGVKGVLQGAGVDMNLVSEVNSFSFFIVQSTRLFYFIVTTLFTLTKPSSYIFSKYSMRAKTR